MAFFKDFIIIALLTGVFTQGLIWLYARFMELKYAFYLSYITVLVIMGPIVAKLLGFDVAIAQFSVALIMWFIFGKLILNYMGKKI